MFAQMLQPFIDRIMEVERHVEDLQRRADGIVRRGVCASVDTGAGKCVVTHGELTTPPIQYMHPSAGEQSETRHPSVGEHCVLLNFGGGENGTLYVALFGLPSGAFPMTSSQAEVTKRVHKDGTSSSYDDSSSEFSWKNGPLSVTANRDGLVVMLGAIGFKLDATGFDHVGGLLTHNKVNVGFDHLHANTQPREGAVSGPPAGAP